MAFSPPFPSRSQPHPIFLPLPLPTTTSAKLKLRSVTNSFSAVAKMWFSEMGNRVGNGLKRRSHVDSSDSKCRPSREKPKTLAILSFETGKTMSRLVSLYKSITDEEITKLHKETMKSEGVTYLISNDQDFLLKLACKEKQEEVDRAAVTVARLGKSCFDSDLTQFDRVYEDLKLGFIDLSNYFVEKEIEKTMDKMEKYVSTTAELYAGLEALAEMEISEKKLKSWNYSGQILTVKNQKNQKGNTQKANFDLFDQKLAWQRNRVRHLRQVSLWGQTFDKTVRLMARAICIVFARMCVVFSPYISIMPRSLAARNAMQESESDELLKYAGPSTAGGSGFTVRFANIILMAERYLYSRSTLDEGGREELYNMLPASLRRLVNIKLKKIIRENEVGTNGDKPLVEKWREVSKQTLQWLAPIAHDTIRWKMERNVEKQSFDARPKVLLLQTFYFADRVKTEEAIVEVLVGLSCICRYQPRRASPM